MYNIVNFKPYEKTLLKAIRKHLKRSAYILYEPLLKQCSRAIYKANNPDSKIKCDLTIDEAELIQNAFHDDFMFKLASQKKKAISKQKNRFNKRIKQMLYLSAFSTRLGLNKYYCFFATFTFNNQVLKLTNEATRKIYIARFLKKHCSYYIANIDYGSKNEREHYHAIILLNENQSMNLCQARSKKRAGFSFLDYQSQFGFNFIELVNLGEADFESNFIKLDELLQSNNSNCVLASYISKLTNHAYKKSTSESRLIYCKNKRLIVLGSRSVRLDALTLQLGLDLFGSDMVIS